jgi:hypothetical protein
VGGSFDIRPAVALVAEVIPAWVNGRPFGIQKKIPRPAFTFGFTNSPGTTVSQRAGTRLLSSVVRRKFRPVSAQTAKRGLARISPLLRNFVSVPGLPLPRSLLARICASYLGHPGGRNGGVC